MRGTFSPTDDTQRPRGRARRVSPWIAVAGVLLALAPGPLAAQQLKAVADSFAYRVATFSPESGPPGTQVTVTWENLPALTPVQIGVGNRTGWEVLKQALTDQHGSFTDTIVIPPWADRSQTQALLVFDLYFHALAVSEKFMVTDPRGRLIRDGRMVEAGPRCARLETGSGEVVHLYGDTRAVRPGEPAIVEGTLGDSALCGEGFTIRVTSIRRGVGT